MSAASSASPDVVVIGGGPAGSTVSTLLAKHGRRVLLFEGEDEFDRVNPRLGIVDPDGLGTALRKL